MMEPLRLGWLIGPSFQKNEGVDFDSILGGS